MLLLLLKLLLTYYFTRCLERKTLLGTHIDLRLIKQLNLKVVNKVIRKVKLPV